MHVVRYGNPSGRTVGGWINEFLVRRGCYDPRKFNQFLETVLEENESLESLPLQDLLDLFQRSSGYYELWRVKPDLQVDELFDHLQERLNHIKRKNKGAIQISICEICSDGHHNERYTLELRQ